MGAQGTTGGLRHRHARSLRARALATNRRGRHPAHGSGRSDGRGPPDHRPDRQLAGEIHKQVDKKQRTLITVLTKKMAEDMTDYLRQMGIKVNYLHSDVDTLERVEILRDLRLGVFDVLVGINLLREGLDLPEVALIAILDADKES